MKRGAVVPYSFAQCPGDLGCYVNAPCIVCMVYHKRRKRRKESYSALTLPKDVLLFILEYVCRIHGVHWVTLAMARLVCKRWSVQISKAHLLRAIHMDVSQYPVVCIGRHGSSIHDMYTTHCTSNYVYCISWPLSWPTVSECDHHYHLEESDVDHQCMRVPAKMDAWTRADIAEAARELKHVGFPNVVNRYLVWTVRHAARQIIL